MTKQKRSESASIRRSKRVKAQPKDRSPPPDYQQLRPDPLFPMEDVAMEAFARTDPTTTSPRHPSPELLSLATQRMSAHAFDDDDPAIPDIVYFFLRDYFLESSTVPENFVTRNVFRRNISHKKDQAVREKDWKDVITHDLFWTEFSANSSSRRKAPPFVLLPIEKADDHVPYSFTRAARDVDSTRIVKTRQQPFLDRGVCQPGHGEGT
ncbi:hypothetical protein BJV78DRAFT_1241761 [Lactifluus subvellereus]|nr:hypothetical protein BJV78DRAFT_1241761 [Lactifluus subvellereus]